MPQYLCLDHSSERILLALQLKPTSDSADVGASRLTREWGPSSPTSNGPTLRQAAVAAPKGGEFLLPLIQELLAQAGLSLTQLDGIAVGIGPGAFTGLRVAVGVAQGLALGADLPLLGVDTLAMAAQDALDRCPDLIDGQITVALDARLGELYVDELTVAQGQLQVLGPRMGAQLQQPAELVARWRTQPPDWVCGTGLTSLEAYQGSGRCIASQATAHALATCAERTLAGRGATAWQAPETIELFYLRNHVAKTLAERGVVPLAFAT